MKLVFHSSRVLASPYLSLGQALFAGAPGLRKAANTPGSLHACSQHSIALMGGHDHRAMAKEAVGSGPVSSGTGTWLEASPKHTPSLVEYSVREAATRFAGLGIRQMYEGRNTRCRTMRA